MQDSMNNQLSGLFQSQGIITEGVRNRAILENENDYTERREYAISRKTPDLPSQYNSNQLKHVFQHSLETNVPRRYEKSLELQAYRGLRGYNPDEGQYHTPVRQTSTGLVSKYHSQKELNQSPLNLRQLGANPYEEMREGRHSRASGRVEEDLKSYLNQERA